MLRPTPPVPWAPPPPPPPHHRCHPPVGVPITSLQSISSVNVSTIARVTARSSLSSPPESSELLPNALRRRSNPAWGGGGFSLGVDLGGARTGLALGKGFSSPRPHPVLELRGQKLELRLLEIAEQQEVDEFIIGLPKSHDGKETPQSNKVRSIAGRFAARAAERGLRIYLQDEHGSSIEALDAMIEMGLNKSARQGRIDAYAAVMILDRYFSMAGSGAELVLPKQSELQEKLVKGPDRDLDF